MGKKNSLAGRNIWLIGASTGIGRALAARLASEGANLALTARSAGKLEEVADEIARDDFRPIVVPADVTEDESLKRAYEAIGTTFNGLDILIYNAGTYHPCSATEAEAEVVLREQDVNFLGAIRAIGLALPKMLERGNGWLVGIASVVGYRGLPRSAGYGASKAALIHYLESTRFDVEPHGVDVTIVNPGFVKTRLTEKNDFPMPFCITPEAAARQIVAGLKKRRNEVHFPWQFSWQMKLLRVIPYPLYDRIISSRVVRR